MHQRVAAINDLSGLGRCSLTADIAVLAAMGIEACPMPTAVLTSQTGYPGYRCLSFADRMDDYTEHWQELQVSFAGILSGYLATPDAAEKVRAFLDRFHRLGVLYLCDPVLGDNGRAYRGFTEASIEAVRQLAFQADLLTPNLTEFCILTGTDMRPIQKLGQTDPEALFPILEEKAGCFQGRSLVITGIPVLDKNRETPILSNFIVKMAGGKSSVVSSPHLGGSYSGTGDLFAAVVLGALLQKRSLEEAVRLAVGFIARGIGDARRENTPCNDGINYEPYLGLLAPPLPHGSQAERKNT